MAMITKVYLMEQVRSLLAGGNPSAGAKFEPRMILTHIAQVINRRLKTEYFSVTLPSDETLPDGLVIATYDRVPVESYKDRSRSALPAMPISLRRGMGIYHVSDPGDLDNPFIPLQSGQNAFIKNQKLINNLLGQKAYEPVDGYLVYTTDLTKQEFPLTEVFMRLVVMDFDKYDDYDLLPLTADIGGEVVKEVTAMLLGTPSTDKRVDSTVEDPIPARP